MKEAKRTSIPSLIWDGSANVQKWILFGLSLFLTVMLNAASGMRYFFDKDLFGAESSLSSCGLLALFPGGFYREL